MIPCWWMATMIGASYQASQMILSHHGVIRKGSVHGTDLFLLGKRRLKCKQQNYLIVQMRGTNMPMSHTCPMHVPSMSQACPKHHAEVCHVSQKTQSFPGLGRTLLCWVLLGPSDFESFVTGPPLNCCGC